VIGLLRRRRRDPLVCREFVQLISDYLDGSLPERETRRFQAHLAECDGCEGYLDDVARVVGSLHEATLPAPDPHTRESLLRAFRELRGG
jgi:predicted anti-sigma-YlaC factor YlaD